MKKLGIGLYGTNGHQIEKLLAAHPRVRLVAVAAFGDRSIPAECGKVTRYATLEELLADEHVEMVSLCSPRRADQAADAVKCLLAGRHVYGEKPSALREEDLDRIIATVAQTGFRYHEMGGVALEQPYLAMRDCIRSGAIGEVVQVFVQKSYPWADWRPKDEAIDGGLATQVGIYPLRFIEQVAGLKATSVEIRETRLGNDQDGSDFRRAVSMLMTMENGGVASAICNYLNPLSHLVWGYEILRVFGTAGIVESNTLDGTALLLKPDAAPELLDISAPAPSSLDLMIESLLDGTPMPISLTEELSPSRWVVRAHCHEPLSVSL
jgi:predicted dehydrogenase